MLILGVSQLFSVYHGGSWLFSVIHRFLVDTNCKNTLCFSTGICCIVIKDNRWFNLSFQCTQGYCTSSEVEKAKQAAASGPRKGKTVFEKIVARELPADIIYEDDQVGSTSTIHIQ